MTDDTPRDPLAATGRLMPWQIEQLDKRLTCSCGHAHRDHATGGMHCLGASMDETQVTGHGMCQCSEWMPLEPRYRRNSRGKA